MNLIIVLLLSLLIVPPTAGLLAAATDERTGLRRGFLPGLGITGLWAALCFAIEIPCRFITDREFMSILNKLLTVPGFHLFKQVWHQQLPASWRWSVAAWLFLLALFLYLIAFNCRKRAKNDGMTWVGILMFVLVLAFCAPWGFFGLTAIIQFLQGITKAPPVLAAIWTLFVLTAGLLSGWTVLAFRRKSQGRGEILFAHAGIFAGIYAAIWLLSLVIAYPYGKYELRRVGTQKGAAFCLKMELPPNPKAETEKFSRFREKYPDFMLPINGVYTWTKPETRKPQERFPEKVRSCTLKLFDSPEFNRCQESMIQATREAVSQHRFPGKARAYVRVCAGKAALYRETGQTAKILPELEKAAVIDTVLLKSTPFQIEELVRTAIRFIRIATTVSIGPDGPQYAPAYRKMLNQLKSEQVRIPLECGTKAKLLDDALHFRSVWKWLLCPSTRYVECLNMPLLIVKMANQVRTVLNGKEFARELEKREVFHLSEDANPIFPNWEWIAFRARTSLSMGKIALALKVYRSEKGRYPKTLDALAPDYLDRIPPAPLEGSSFQYRSDGKNFKLAIVAPSMSFPNPYGISSEPNY